MSRLESPIAIFMAYKKSTIDNQHNVLITGARGLIGTALIERLKSTKCSLFCQSRAHHNSTSRIRWIQHNLVADSWAKRRLPVIHYVFHLAGQTSIYEAKKNPVADLESNVLGLLKLMEYLKTQSHCPIVIITGTATQAGINRKNPINEKTRDNPCTFYDISKLSAEMYLKQYIKEGWIQGCALRLGNVYGKRQDSQNINRGILDKIYLQALSGKTIKVFVKQTCKRDYIYIDDVVSALCAAAINAKKTNGQTFYIGSGKGTSIGGAFRHVISLAAHKTGKRVKIKNVKAPGGLSEIENRNVVIDSSKFKRVTGWRPNDDFYEQLTQKYA